MQTMHQATDDACHYAMVALRIATESGAAETVTRNLKAAVDLLHRAHSHARERDDRAAALQEQLRLVLGE